MCNNIFMQGKKKEKEKSNTVKIIDDNVMRDAKIVVIRKGYDSLQEYVTEAVRDKNQREK